MRNQGVKVSNEMVRTLMRDMGLVSIRQNAKKLHDDESRKYKTTLIRSLMSAILMKCGSVMLLISSTVKTLITFVRL